jgi:flagellar basal-body rod protein FlgB
MAITDVSLFSALKTRMNWLQQRQSLLAENVANADTPHYRPRDLTPIDPAAARREQGGGGLTPVRTHASHMLSGMAANGEARAKESDTFEVRPRGNAVSLEQEMMKVTETQLDYQLASGLYSRGIGLLKTALGRRA